MWVESVDREPQGERDLKQRRRGAVWFIKRIFGFGFPCVFFVLLPSLLLFYADRLVCWVFEVMSFAPPIDPQNEFWGSLVEGSYFLSVACEYVHRFVSYVYARMRGKVANMVSTRAITFVLLASVGGALVCIALGTAAIYVYAAHGNAPFPIDRDTFLKASAVTTLASVGVLGLIDHYLTDLKVTDNADKH